LFARLLWIGIRRVLLGGSLVGEALADDVVGEVVEQPFGIGVGVDQDAALLAQSAKVLLGAPQGPVVATGAVGRRGERSEDALLPLRLAQEDLTSVNATEPVVTVVGFQEFARLLNPAKLVLGLGQAQLSPGLAQA